MSGPSLGSGTTALAHPPLTAAALGRDPSWQHDRQTFTHTYEACVLDKHATAITDAVAVPRHSMLQCLVKHAPVCDVALHSLRAMRDCGGGIAHEAGRPGSLCTQRLQPLSSTGHLLDLAVAGLAANHLQTPAASSVVQSQCFTGLTATLHRNRYNGTEASCDSYTSVAFRISPPWT